MVFSFLRVCGVWAFIEGLTLFIPTMKRSEINLAYRQAKECFVNNGWKLPPNARWDITDFGLGRFREYGLVLINLAEEAEYCEKLMWAAENQKTPLHTHKKKKEDIIARNGKLALRLWPKHPSECRAGETFSVRVCGEERILKAGEELILQPGERVTLVPSVYHEFWPKDEATVIGEVSTANDDLNDNFFVDDSIGRYPGIEENEAAEVRLISETLKS